MVLGFRCGASFARRQCFRTALENMVLSQNDEDDDDNDRKWQEVHLSCFLHIDNTVWHSQNVSLADWYVFYLFVMRFVLFLFSSLHDRFLNFSISNANANVTSLDQYPDIINNRLEEGLAEDIEVDNFYLDMNGIIHPCTHGNAEGELIFLDETAMFKKIFLYVDRLYKMVQPNKVLYLAVDGVAPRAKMNQQRSRRFRSAKEAEQLAAELSARENFMGHELSVNSDKQRFDSNCITPGTDFMLKLSMAIQKWVEYKQETDPFWKTGATVIVSGPDVPGEGEHKVMDFIRDSQQQYRKDGKATDMYGPGRTHVLYGLDADLIMVKSMCEFDSIVFCCVLGRSYVCTSF
jgi:XRN 5'-3' exonuclease N-terminus